MIKIEEKILKVISIISIFLALLVCISLQFFPGMHEKSMLTHEARKKIANGNIRDMEVVSTIAEPEDIVEIDDSHEELKTQLKIQIPEGNEKDSVIIESDHYNKDIYLRFKNGVEDFFSQYKIKGSCDHISSLSYYQDGNDGVIAFSMDEIYVTKWDYEDNYVYLDFCDPHKVYDKIVVVDAGHGDRACGAVRMGYMEKDINLGIVTELKKLEESKKDKIGFFYTRTDDSNPTLEQRVGLANELKADLFISVHNNSSGNGNFSGEHGTQVMYDESDDSKKSGKDFAQICLESVSKATGSNKVGLLKGDKIHIIRNSKNTVALIEVGFMTNKEELSNLVTEEYQKQTAEGIYEGILVAFKEGY